MSDQSSGRLQVLLQLSSTTEPNGVHRSPMSDNKVRVKHRPPLLDQLKYPRRRPSSPSASSRCEPQGPLAICAEEEFRWSARAGAGVAGGGTHFVARLSHLTIDHASLWRRSRGGGSSKACISEVSGTWYMLSLFAQVLLRRLYNACV